MFLDIQDFRKIDISWHPRYLKKKTMKFSTKNSHIMCLKYSNLGSCKKLTWANLSLFFRIFNLRNNKFELIRGWNVTTFSKQFFPPNPILFGTEGLPLVKPKLLGILKLGEL